MGGRDTSPHVTFHCIPKSRELFRNGAARTHTGPRLRDGRNMAAAGLAHSVTDYWCHFWVLHQKMFFFFFTLNNQWESLNLTSGRKSHSQSNWFIDKDAHLSQELAQHDKGEGSTTSRPEFFLFLMLKSFGIFRIIFMLHIFLITYSFSSTLLSFKY